MHGIWNLDDAKLTLGGALIFAQEIAAVSTLHNDERSIVWFVGTSEQVAHHPGNSRSVDRIGARSAPPLVGALLGLDVVKACYHSRSSQLAEDRLPTRGRVWRAVGSESTASVGSLSYLQAFHSKHGGKPNLRFRPSLVRRVHEWVTKRLGGACPVSLHLKSQGTGRRDSNAHWPAWRKFLREVSVRKDVAFVFLGSDPVPDDIARLANVFLPRNEGLDLAHQLALVSQSHFFMGMSSGVCNAAILSDVPYVIYKNPSHHRREMIDEIGHASRFSFSLPHQEFLRETESSSLLSAQFERMNTSSNRRVWRARMARIAALRT